jgi:hypothetical protein
MELAARRCGVGGADPGGPGRLESRLTTTLDDMVLLLCLLSLLFLSLLLFLLLLLLFHEDVMFQCGSSSAMVAYCTVGVSISSASHGRSLSIHFLSIISLLGCFDLPPSIHTMWIDV